MKKCTKCGETKSLSEFGKHSASKDGINPWCKKCVNASSRKWSKTSAGIYSGITGRTNYYKRKQVHIDREDFIEWYDTQQRICVYCDILEKNLYILQEHYGSVKTRLTVDCMDNTLGYSKGNLVLACDKCNQIKNNVLSFDEMKYIGQNFLKPKWQNFDLK